MFYRIYINIEKERFIQKTNPGHTFGGENYATELRPKFNTDSKVNNDP